MASCPRAKVYDRAGDILCLAETLVRVEIGEGICTTGQIHETICHFGREEAWGNAVDENSSWAEFDREVAGEVNCRGFGGAVTECGVLTQGPNSESCNRCGDNYTGWVLDGRFLLEEGSESVCVSVSAINVPSCVSHV